MFQLIIDERDIWDERKEEFIHIHSGKYYLEHSLESVSKWESKYHKPFLSSEKTNEETIDYVSMMVINAEVDPIVFEYLRPDQIVAITEYIEDSMTATWFSEDYDSEGKLKKTPKVHLKKGEVTTSELIYYWMTALNIPFECEKWHLSRLLTLIRVCSIKNQPKDKKKLKPTQSEMAKRRAIMEARRAKYHTNG